MKDQIITSFWRILGVGLIVMAAYRPDILVLNAFGMNLAMSWAGGAGFLLLLFPPNKVARPLQALGRTLLAIRSKMTGSNTGGNP